MDILVDKMLTADNGRHARALIKAGPFIQAGDRDGQPPRKKRFRLPA
jgi:hypothetical protein